jgi:hypothetical protein
MMAADYVQDSFTDTDEVLLTAHTPEVGGTWEQQSGSSLLIRGNQLVADAVGALAWNNTVIAGDHYVEFEVKIRDGEYPWLTIRYSRSVGSYEKYYKLETGNGQVWKIWAKAGGPNIEELLFTSSASTGLGKHRIEVVGTTVSVHFWNGSSWDTGGSYEDTVDVITGGNPGLYLQGGGVNNNVVDSFRAAPSLTPPDTPTNFKATCTKVTKAEPPQIIINFL